MSDQSLEIHLTDRALNYDGDRSVCLYISPGNQQLDRYVVVLENLGKDDVWESDAVMFEGTSTDLVARAFNEAVKTWV